MPSTCAPNGCGAESPDRPSGKVGLATYSWFSLDWLFFSYPTSESRSLPLGILQCLPRLPRIRFESRDGDGNTNQVSFASFEAAERQSNLGQCLESEEPALSA